MQRKLTGAVLGLALCACAVRGPVSPPEPATLTMKPKLFRVILPVGDVDAAARFYQAVLGSPGQRVSGGRHYFDCDGTILACFDPRADGDAYDAVPNPEWLYFAVDDLEAVWAACRDADARFADGDVHGAPAGRPSKRPWGERSFYAHDPFGNKLCFVDRRTLFTGR
jgi:catechol 2,3-dioxygenase-like lactoylglutathione lyase family enzyme